MSHRLCILYYQQANPIPATSFLSVLTLIQAVVSLGVRWPFNFHSGQSYPNPLRHIDFELSSTKDSAQGQSEAELSIST
ncbi:hypothetical protein BDV25DRAFT_88062 [Aspergillus avenaceus]|uniref:Uncharacterized protein n=1 Tax=Aspergillus avenaceus TaxID=36643 RepID=A0A5N6TEA0_ASPAV|nr:hypothetical protein BDV25DRAFT_88062 [Aspergillus avenaceus]